MTKAEAIKNYNLKRITGNFSPVETWQAVTDFNNVKTVITLTQDEKAKSEGVGLFYIVVQKWDNNQRFTDKNGVNRCKLFCKILPIEN